MPQPKDGESKNSWMSRCVPTVKKEGTAKNNEQAQAICLDMFSRQRENKTGRKKLEQK